MRWHSICNMHKKRLDILFRGQRDQWDGRVGSNKHILLNLNLYCRWGMSSVKLQMGLVVYLKRRFWLHLRPCENVCSGPWDFVCFIEHLCVSNLLKLLMILVLCYITLLFFYLLFKLGLFQCIGKSLCKMCWAAYETYWYALEDITYFLWYKLKNTKRVNRRHYRHHHHQVRDIEQGYSSSEEIDFWDNYHNLNVSRKRKSLSRRRKDKRQRSFNPSSRHGTHSHHHVKSRGMSVHVVGRSRRLRSSRHLQSRKVRNVRTQARTSKRRKL